MHVVILDVNENKYEGPANSLKLPGVDGSFEVLKDHAPMIAILGEGVIKLVPKTNEISSSSFEEEKKNPLEFSIKGGLAKINQNKVVILI